MMERSDVTLLWRIFYLFTLRYPADAGTYLQISGTVRVKNGQPYIEVPKKKGW